MKIVIINGAGESGKDSFVLFVRKHSKTSIQNLSTIKAVKRIAIFLGWDRIKDEKGRKFLSDLKMAWTAYNNGPFNNVIKSIDINSTNIYFIHAREPENIKEFQDYFGIDNVETLLITRPNLKVPKNYADLSVNNFTYDTIINNDGTLEDLEQKAIKYLKYLKEK